jgi:hypothetical protein
MGKNGLSPDDIRLILLCRVAGIPDRPIQGSPLPAPGEIGAFITQLEELSALTRVDFLGIMWEQDDRDPRAKGKQMWITEFADDKRAALEMVAFKNKLASMSAPK